ncbi:glycoside hydrolase family 15 protein [Corynebacterium glutamicum]|uniref:glycoside hydrolase family 15 protein n=1 Tax=Corynebacterium glutamicum TaxID=1718 RepID=UPI000B361BB2|nr:glycoside hydrolase family 15 protein [Corynebacterium glutamicum]
MTIPGASTQTDIPLDTLLEDYALLSDTHTGALLSNMGSLDWLCLPRFDSQAMFTRLLGDREHGHWSLRVPGGEVISQNYLGDSFVVQTVWRSETGTARVVDFMPIHGQEQPDITDLVRSVHCVEGEVDVESILRLRFDYGESTPYFRTSTVDGISIVQAVAGPNAVYVRGPEMPHRPAKDCHSGTFHLTAGESVEWVLTWAPSFEPHPPMPDYTRSLESTLSFWASWVEELPHQRLYDAEVRRSMLVLRALTDLQTGGIVAAPTTSLPEDFGGIRNWDYRYVWLRDSALTIEALVEYGYSQAALQWRTWLLRAIAGDPENLRIMYGLGGERHLPERELQHLRGYENSVPVRVGNGAAEQYQADVVGEVMVALETIRRAGCLEDEFSWGMQKAILDFQEANFDRKDQGIWEMRSEPKYFTHGRAMMWAGFDRGIKAIEEFNLDGPIERWRELRAKLREEIMANGFNEEIQSFTQCYDNTQVDASLLQLAQIGFIGFDDPKMLSTVARIEQELLDAHGFLHRYHTDGSDGLAGDEYPFLICSFWLVEQYARSNRLDEAKEKMNRILAVQSPLGLLAEEYSTHHGRLAGNYPQAFSHIGLISAARAINFEEARNR